MVGGGEFFEMGETVHTKDVRLSMDDGEVGDFPFAMLT